MSTYVVPAKIPVQAKKLIENFEKGKLQVEVDKDASKQVLYREMSQEELARPGTARKLLMEFETMKKNQESLKSPPVKSPSSGKLKEKFEELEVEKETQVLESSSVSINDNLIPDNQDKNELINGTDDIVHEVVEKEESEIEVIATLDRALESNDEVLGNLESNAVEGSKNVLLISFGHTDLIEKTLTEFKKSNTSVEISCLEECVMNDEESILAERKKLSSADLVVIHYKHILNTIPSKVKEWLEKVLADSSNVDNGIVFEKGELKGKKCLLLIDTGLDQSMFANSLLGDISNYVWPIQYGILHFVGFDVLTPEIIYKSSNDPMESWSSRLINIWNEKSACIPEP